MFQIPLALQEFVLENIPDDTGFTATEKRSLKNAWAMISSEITIHALEQSLRFFTENEEMLDKFRNEHGEFKIKALHEHPFKTFDMLENLIFEGLEGSTQMNAIINPIAIGHLHKNIERENIKKMSDHLSEYLKEILRKVMSPTLENAIDKICDIIVMAH